MTTIKAKISVAFGMVIMTAVLLVTLAASYNSSAALKDNAIVYISDSIRHADENLQVLLEDIDKISTVIAVNKDRVTTKVMSPYEEPVFEWFQEKKAVEDFLASLIAYKSYISRIAVIGLNGKIYQSGEPLVRKSVLQEPWVKQVLSHNKRKFLFNSTANGEIMLARPLYFDNEPVGLIMIDFNPSIIRKIYDIQPLTDSVIALMDSEGQIVYHSGGSNVNKNVSETYLSELYHDMKQNIGEEGRVKKMNGQTYLTVDYHSEFTDWTTIGMIPQNTLLRQAQMLTNQMILISIAVLLGVLVASVFVSKRITKNLTLLRNAMKLVSIGKLSAKPNIQTKDEVGQLSEMFTSMMTNLQELMSEIRDSERKKREAEFKALQSQVNPHFLYNTLNTIKYLAHLQHVPNIYEISGSLVELLRNLADFSKEMVTIREELEYIKQYLNIQKYRLLEPLSVTYELEEELLDCLLPKLLLQPLVENAILHGLIGLDRPGLISIKVFKEDELVRLEVSDNGPSSEMRKEATQSKPDKGISIGIGMHNVNERIKMAFGDKYGVSLYSLPGFMTTASILIPEVKEDYRYVMEGIDRR